MFFSPSVLLASGLIFIGFLMLIVGFISLADEANSLVVSLLWLLVGGALPMLFGAFWLRSVLKKDEKEHLAAQELEALGVIAKMGGKVTPLELSNKMLITLEQSQNLLENMQKSGRADLRVTDKGDILYEVKNIVVTKEEKENSQSV